MVEELKEDTQSEVDLMNKSFDEGLGAEETETEETETKETEETTETETKEEEKETETETETKETETETKEIEETEETETKETEPDEKDKTITELRAELVESKAKEVKETETETKTKTEEKESETPLTLEDQDFLGELDLDEVTRNPKEFNKLLNKIYKQAVTDTRKVLGEGILRTIPDIVKTNIAAITNLQKARDKFYDDNEDLKPFKKVVGVVFEELAAENPDKKYDEVLSDVGDEVRKRLELQKNATSAKTKPNKSDPPKLPRKKGKAGQTKNEPLTEPLLNEIGEMNQTLGR